MKNKKKVFNTKKINGWKKMDIIVILLIFIICAYNIYTGYKAGAFVGLSENKEPIVYLFIGILILIMVFIRSLPFFAIYFTMRHVIKKHRVSKSTFNANSDIEYYREIFNGVSPATMSLIMDLGLENEKDLGAMRLYYELNNIIKYDNTGKMYIDNLNTIKINKSDEILLNYFLKEKNDFLVLNEWKETVICENVNEGLIRRKKDKEKKKSGCFLYILAYILVFGMLGFIIWFLSTNYNNIEDFGKMLDSAPDSLNNVEFLNYMTRDKKMVEVALLLLAMIICMFLQFGIFVAGFVYLFTFSVVRFKDKIKRTEQGDFLAEKLYGMKNFIRDFSNLDEASKQHIVLWRDFLIYAVVLEENEVILKEISDMYKVNLFNYKK